MEIVRIVVWVSKSFFLVAKLKPLVAKKKKKKKNSGATELGCTALFFTLSFPSPHPPTINPSPAEPGYVLPKKTV